MSESEISNKTTVKEFDFQILLQVIKKTWYWIFIFMFIFVSLAFVYLRYTKPVFESSMIIQLDTKDEGEQVLEMELSNNSSEKLSENVELLKSSLLIRQALDKLPLEIGYHVQGEILGEEKYLSSGYTVTILHSADTLRNFDQYNVTEVEKNYITIEHDGVEKEYDISEPITINNITFGIEINNLESLKEQLAQNKIHFKVNNLDQLAKHYARLVDVKVINPEAKTIRIAFRSYNPQLSKDLVESLNQTFNEFDLNKKSQSSQSILNFINNQVDTVFISLKNSELKIQNYKKSAELKDPKLLSSSLQHKLNIFQNELLIIQIEDNLLGEVNQQVNKELTIDDLFNIMPALAGSRYEAVLSPGFEKLKETIIKREAMLTSFTDKNKSIQEVDESLEVQKKMIQSAVNTIKIKNAERKVFLISKIDELEADFYTLPEKEMELARLQRVFELNEKYYNLLLEKRTQYSIAKAGFTPSNRVLEPASINLSPVSPNKKLIILTALFLGFFLGLVLILLKYIRFDKIPDEKTFRRWLPDNVGFLGSIPKVRSTTYSTVRVHLEPKSRLTESLRSIRTNLDFIKSNDNGPRMFGITSTTSGEGKTFVSANLAGVLAMTGKKVLILDFDLRKPKLHFAFNAENNSDGVSSILSGRANWKDCLQQSNIPNLDYIPAGISPPNPSELINNDYTKAFLNEAKEEYDEIIIDTPPIGLVSDGIKVLNYVDFPIYIFRANYSKKNFINELKDVYDFEKIKNIYIILNGEAIAGTKYGYGYGYYYERKSKTSFFKKK